MSKPKQVRVIVWSTPRSLSTAFLKSMSTFENAEIFQEPFVSAALFGPDRDKKTITDEMNAVVENLCSSEYTFDGVKAMLEQEYPDKDVVFSKDGGLFIHGHFDKIPSGFKHVFLTRKPGKVLASSQKLIDSIKGEPHLSCRPNLPGTPHRQLLETAEYVRDHLNQAPVVIDADDLQMKPQEVMRAFCEQVGLPFSEKMMTWKQGPDPRWRQSPFKKMACEMMTANHEKAFNSTGFDKHIPSSEPALEEMNEVTRTMVTKAQPYYDKLMTMKLKI
ncbi:uncharacterized protein [Antedon mediterranea]|uniref:uncharacterized protein n=1 Tax=Antedon mediterranea TaxID=105859 RepID=UPI003AF63805